MKWQPWCELCWRLRLLDAAQGLPAPWLAVIAKASKYQWSSVDRF